MFGSKLYSPTQCSKASGARGNILVERKIQVSSRVSENFTPLHNVLRQVVQEEIF